MNKKVKKAATIAVAAGAIFTATQVGKKVSSDSSAKPKQRQTINAVMQNVVTPSTIIPDDRLAPWQGNVGVPGGIPSRTTIFQTLTPSGGDDGPAITSALNACPANQVVLLSAGTFQINSTVSTFMKGNRTLRGAGQGQTILQLHGNANIYLRGSAGWPPSTNWVPVTGGATKGSNTITVADTTPFSVDQPISIGPNRLPSWAHNLGGFPDTERTLFVTFKVRSKTATSVTFDPPIPFDMSGMTPMVLPQNGTLVQGLGVESFTIDCTNGTAPFPLEYENAFGSWIQDVEVLNAVSRQMFVTNSVRCEIRRCYTHTEVAAGPNHEGITLSGSWNLVEDNICNRGGAMAIIFSDGGRGASCNVISYNYIVNTEPGWWDISFCHGTGSWLNLAEGNVMHWYKDDGYFGSSSYTTLLRNRIDWQTGLKHFSNYYNIVGNVLGTAGVNTVYESSLNGPFESSIFELGYPNIGNQNWTVDYGPQNPPDYSGLGNTLDSCQQRDLNVKATIIRHGNWDAIHNGVVWDPNIPDHTIPNSYIYSSKPAWWDTDLPWPAIGPDLTPMVGMIPAQRRFGGVTPSPIPSPLPTATATATATIAPSPTPTATFTPTPTATATATATLAPPPTPTATATIAPSPTPTPVPVIGLTANIYKWRGRYQADLIWYGSTAENMDIYRNGIFLIKVQNTGWYSDSLGRIPTAVYRVCESDTTNCSNYAP